LYEKINIVNKNERAFSEILNLTNRSCNAIIIRIAFIKEAYIIQKLVDNRCMFQIQGGHKS